MKKTISTLLCVLLSICLSACSPTVSSETIEESKPSIREDTECDDEACVASYLHVYDHLPANYMTKEEARKQGWTAGALHLVVPGKCIGGDVFGNYEETLPTEDTYHECDIDTLHSKSRGAKRIAWSDDGDIWYTDDHYETWTLLYGEGK